ncbi:MAG TPA: hypothetical protein VNV86_21845 [Candidatus Acidoferrum sp.]|nr:hypothetical protein [Candidatus Acidoferrum sp.]
MRLLLATLLLTVAPSYAGPALDVLLPPGATAVFGLRASSILNLLAQQEGAKDLRTQVSALLAMSPWSGFDPFRDIDEVVIAAMASGQNPPTLAVITGRFDAAKLAQGKGQAYRSATLVQDAKSKQVLAILDDNTLLAGDMPLVKAAIDRASGSVAAGPLAARIEGMRTKYDLWAFADHLDAAAMSSTAASLKGLDRLWFGAAFSHNFELAAELHLRSSKDVSALTAMLRDLEKQVKSQIPSNDPTTFDLHTTDNTISVAIAVPEEAWKKAFASRLQAPTQSQSQPPAKPRIYSTEPQIVSTDPGAQPKPQVITKDSTGNTVMVTLPGKH